MGVWALIHQIPLVGDATGPLISLWDQVALYLGFLWFQRRFCGNQAGGYSGAPTMKGLVTYVEQPIRAVKSGGLKA